jgi:hypothetical protein
MCCQDAYLVPLRDAGRGYGYRQIVGAIIDGRPGSGFALQMCNLYSVTCSQEAMRRLFQVKRDLTGNLPGLRPVYSDTMAPVVRTARDG